MPATGLAGKHYWITGGGSGIGRELALQMARAGCQVYVSGRRAAPLDELAQQFPGYITSIVADVTDPAGLQQAMHQISANTPCLDGVILSAGVCEYMDLPDLDETLMRRVMEINFHGVVNCVQAALPLLQAAGKLHPDRKPELIGIGSMSSYVGFPRAEAYGSAKAAMAYFLDSLRCDLGKQLTVTVVYPGFVDTPLTRENDFPMPFLITAQAAAGHIIKHLGQGRRRLQFPWQLHAVLTVARCLPALWYGPLMNKLTRQQSAQA